MNELGIRQQLEEIASLLREGDHYLIFSHERPDADSVGSSLALAYALRRLGKQVKVFLSDAGFYQFAIGEEPIHGPEDLPTDPWPHPVIVLDCESSRTGEFAAFTQNAPVIVNIDHHPSNVTKATYRLVEPEAAACGELVFHLVKTLGVSLDQRLATFLYIALAGDTGGFRFSNTKARVFKVAASLVEAGADPADVATNLFMRKPLSYFRILSLALSRLRLDASGKVASTAITQEDLRVSGASEEELEGIVDYTRMVIGVEVGILFKEKTDGTVGVSLRSTGRVDVGSIASEFGGGGHVVASGCTVKGSLQEVCTKVIKRTCQAL